MSRFPGHSARRWPLFIVLLGMSFLIFSGWSLHKAVTEVSPALLDGKAPHRSSTPLKGADRGGSGR